MRCHRRTLITSLAGVLAFSVIPSVRLAAAAGDQRLLQAAMRQDRQAVATLLKERVEVNVSQPDGATPLHWAAHWDDLAMVDLLLQAGATIDARNDYGVTPLWLACENGSALVVERLLAAGASPTRRCRPARPS